MTQLEEKPSEKKSTKLSKDELFLHVIELKKILINYQE